MYAKLGSFSCVLFCLFALYAADNSPTVTLSHGGQLLGLSTTFQDVSVDLFLGVRYVQAPVGELRFKKPKEIPAWKGLVEAVAIGDHCPQFSFGKEEPSGREDCLFMDITVPGGVKTANKKPVMMFIHGGAYQKGAKTAYIGAPLAVIGDVIVVTINYRLGVFGFLSDKPGTGNFGLWDQRAALVWVKENIEQFGGDPELVTIFGESAGAGSVAAQAMGQHNDGLFKRAIMESGSLFEPWGWFLEPDMKEETNQMLRKVSNCPPSTQSIYECLQYTPMDTIINNFATLSDLNNLFSPVADGDFFAEDIDIHSYKLTERFDLMAGFNGAEGLIMYIILLGSVNPAAFYGLDANTSSKFLADICSTRITPYSPNLCMKFISETYDLDAATDDVERAERLVQFIGDYFISNDVLFALEQHRSSPKPTYAYYFTERFMPAPEFRLFPIPKWKSTADHADELNFVFGSAFLADEKQPMWKEIISKDPLMSAVFLGATAKDKALSKSMMLMWSNFAKTGNPNEPSPLPVEVPKWPEFNTETNQFLEINSNKFQVITTPNKDRMHKMRQLLNTDRELQYKLSQQIKETTSTSETKKTSSHTEL